MPPTVDSTARDRLKGAFDRQSLSLYLGAGVSVGSQLPTWEKLVTSMYFAVVAEQKMEGWRPYHNYLFAISEWYLGKLQEPLEVTARKTRSLFEADAEGERHFRRAVQEALYGLDPMDQQVLPPPDIGSNDTLEAVAELCGKGGPGGPGVRSVITYNYDNLLELALDGRRPAAAVYSDAEPPEGEMPVFHVHGFVPHPHTVSIEPSEIVFTEEEYNRAAIDPYSWSNIVQIREMSNAVGLMVGLSLADRNIRRLLDALQRSPVRPEIFALLQEPRPVQVEPDETDAIHLRAVEMMDKFENAGIKFGYDPEGTGGARSEASRTGGLKAEMFRGPGTELVGGRPLGVKGGTRYRHEIGRIVDHVDQLEKTFQEEVLRSLGVIPIWYKDHADVPRMIGEIFA